MDRTSGYCLVAIKKTYIEKDTSAVPTGPALDEDS